MNEVGDVVLEGRLLVATPLLEDPHFRRTVVLLLDHGDDGALGVVLNRPSDVPVDEVLGPWGSVVVGHQCSGTAARCRPTPRWRWPLPPGVGPRASVPVGTSGLGLVDLDEDPETVSASVSAVRVYAGYAGWDSGQLEDEVAEGAWYVVDALPGDPFTDVPDVLWRLVLRRQGGDLALVATYPDDPEMN